MVRGITISPFDPAWSLEGDDNLHVVLVEPEIPGNTGNIARLCAGTDAILHLVEPLGFELQDRYLRRAGLDYWPNVTLCVHDSFAAVERLLPADRMVLLTTKTERTLWDTPLPPGCVLVFGRETTGLDDDVRQRHAERCATLPLSAHARSLNLSNAVAVAVYEARRQQGWTA